MVYPAQRLNFLAKLLHHIIALVSLVEQDLHYYRARVKLLILCEVDNAHSPSFDFPLDNEATVQDLSHQALLRIEARGIQGRGIEIGGG
jgi:hypothetical protein